MRYVTIPQLAKHAKRTPRAVRYGLQAAGITPERFPGVKGGRITERDANKFLSRHWPEAGPLPLPTHTAN